MKVTIMQGDVIDSLKQLPDSAVDCVITSPPYYGLRDYGIDGQIGLEKSPENYIKKMLEVTEQLKRVLKKTGTFWLNIGDTYGYHRSGEADFTASKCKQSKERNPIKGQEKCLCMIPERLAMGMIEQGWILRNKIIWHKPNHMPSSVKDRLSNSWEYVFLFSKSKRYYFDLDAIREPHKEESKVRVSYGFNPNKQSFTSGKGFSVYQKGLHEGGKNPGDVISISPQEGLKQIRSWAGIGGHDKTHVRQYKEGTNDDYWDITTQPFPDSHFAVFPERLCENPIKAGCPSDGTVLDPFAGSGTVGVVAIRQRKNSILIELNPKYIEIIKKRLNWGSPFYDKEEVHIRGDR